MACKACEWDEKPIYEDEDIVAILAPEPTNYGHVIVMPKEHYTIMEQVPDDILDKIAVVANKISMRLFESLNIQGTNLLVQNGVAAGQEIPHFMIHLIPRLEKDGIDFGWDPRKLEQEEMSTIEMKIKEQLKRKPVPKSKTQTKPKPESKTQSEPERESKNQSKTRSEIKPEETSSENYLVKQLRRIP